MREIEGLPPHSPHHPPNFEFVMPIQNDHSGVVNDYCFFCYNTLHSTPIETYPSYVEACLLVQEKHENCAELKTLMELQNTKLEFQVFLQQYL